MFKIKNLTMKNFFSIGQVTQSINFSEGNTTLIYGENIDYGEGVRNGVGKAQPLTSKIKIPNGWKTMKEIGVGDIVCTPDGTQTVVVGKYPQGKKAIYEILMSDGRKTQACLEHLWEVFDVDRNRYILNTKDLIEAHKSDKSYYISTIQETYEKDVDLPIDPYVFGCLISKAIMFDDGIYFHNLDPRILSNIEKKYSEYYMFDPKSIYLKMKPKIDDDFVFQYFIQEDLSFIKKIPKIYLDGSYNQRMELLKGIFDCISEYDETFTRIILDESEEIFAKNIQTLIWSLGGICKREISLNSIKDIETVVINSDKDIILKSKFRDTNSFFTLNEKKEYRTYEFLFNKIKSIKKVKEEEACCIKILDENELYITDDYIITHNTTIINGISYALFGAPITNVKQDNMINYINGKAMVVTCEFEVNGKKYKIERGRKPNILNFIRYDDGDKETDMLKSLGENAKTQEVIQHIINISPSLFKQIVAMNTYASSFMASKAAEQRAIIEEILGISLLSSKAERLSEQIKQTKIDIDKENIRIQTLVESNERVKKNIESLEHRSNMWENDKKQKIKSIQESIVQLGDIDIDSEIIQHKKNNEIKEIKEQINYLEKDRNNNTRLKDRHMQSLTNYYYELEQFEKNVCPTCKQKIENNEEHNKHKETVLENVESLLKESEQLEKQINEIDQVLRELKVDEIKPTFYRSLEDALEHKNTINQLENRLQEVQNEKNPYISQIEDLKSSDVGLQDIDYSTIESLEKLLRHQKFLQKLLTNKDSFVRKRIIDQSLPFLNNRLRTYLDTLTLPHDITFDSNLSFNISKMGRNMDFDNLSRGEQNRLILSLNLAFRDLYENLVGPINLLVVDELLDYGMDSIGASQGLDILKKISKQKNKAVYLVTHKEELKEKVEEVILVSKENDFTTFEMIDN